MLKHNHEKLLQLLTKKNYMTFHNTYIITKNLREKINKDPKKYAKFKKVWIDEFKGGCVPYAEFVNFIITGKYNNKLLKSGFKRINSSDEKTIDNILNLLDKGPLVFKYNSRTPKRYTPEHYFFIIKSELKYILAQGYKEAYIQKIKIYTQSQIITLLTDIIDNLTDTKDKTKTWGDLNLSVYRKYFHNDPDLKKLNSNNKIDGMYLYYKLIN